MILMYNGTFHDSGEVTVSIFCIESFATFLILIASHNLSVFKSHLHSLTAPCSPPPGPRVGWISDVCWRSPAAPAARRFLRCENSVNGTRRSQTASGLLPRCQRSWCCRHHRSCSLGRERRQREWQTGKARGSERVSDRSRGERKKVEIKERSGR